MLSERAIGSRRGGGLGTAAVHPVAMTTCGNFALPATERRTAVTPAVAAWVSPFDSPAKTVLATGSVAHSPVGRAGTCCAGRATPRFVGHR